MAALRVPATAGSVPLGAVAALRWEDGAGAIERHDRRRRAAIAADLAPGATLGTALAAIEALPAWRDLPPGVSPSATGDAEVMGELFAGFAAAMGLGVLCVYLVLVLLYRDPVHPLTILVALPLSLGGAAAALHLGGLALDLSALIGLLMLMGLVCKNSILLVDEALQRRRDGLERAEALVAAGLARARAIIMTTLAMVAGMLPILAGFTPDAAFRVPMAAAVVGGLLASTALSLVVVPVAFTVADDLRAWAAARARRLVGGPEPEDLLPAGAGGDGAVPTMPRP
ncbi:MAG: efflux RND transporter permease subunit [Planctomycetes bacterium]|nr:efflux RND transporter permease subunit [Planctomycetota bacterium]